jgi:site-specific DNA-cytosine methylase
MKVLELFAGSRSIGKVAESLGYEVFSSDLNDFEGIDYAVDILNFDITKIPFTPDIIWASPPCTTYSVSAIYYHRPHNKEMSDFAKKSDLIVKKTIQIIRELKPKFWYIENPRGMLRKQTFMEGLPRTTIWYCKYGENRAKPTDIWSNNIRNLINPDGWQPRPECFNGNDKCHHDKQPRGYSAKKASGALGKGTQGMKNNYERSKIPKELCLEILKSI